MEEKDDDDDEQNSTRDMMSQHGNRLFKTCCGKRKRRSSRLQTSSELVQYATYLQSLSTELLSKLEPDYYTSRPRNRKTIMSSNQSSSNFSSNFSSHSFSSSSFTFSRNGEAPQTWRSTQTKESNPQGTTIHRSSEQPGQLPTQEKLQLDAQGKPLQDQTGERGRIEDVSEEDKQYLERMEDEYAKREGGA